MALSYRTFSLVNILVDYAFVAAICITHGDRGSGDEDVATSRVALSIQAAAGLQKQLLLTKPVH